MRSSVREFVASEAMHRLGIPTTRALSLVGTGDQVLRDMFYKCAPLSTRCPQKHTQALTRQQLVCTLSPGIKHLSGAWIK